MTLCLRHLNRKEWKFATNESNHINRPNPRLLCTRCSVRRSSNPTSQPHTLTNRRNKMWILPKQLHTLDSVQGTEALNLDLNESSQLCSQLLFVRSKHSPLRTWLQKWKRDSWSHHLYGRILKPSLGKAFETEWTSFLEATHANHSLPQESEQERKTRDTCGLGSQTEFGFCDQECASSRMSKDTSRWDSPASSAIWKSWVTRCRGEYSARVKLVRLTNARGSSSWPTPQTSDQNGAASSDRPAHRKQLRDVEHGMGVHMKANWPTPKTSMDDTPSDRRRKTPNLHCVVNTCGLPAPANPSTDGSRLESWLTPRANEPEGDPNFVTRNADRGEHCHGSLGSQVKSWATPRANKVHPEITEENRDQLANRNKSNLEEEIAGHCGKATGKLNPRWVETLMGLPIGWTMPSCTRPVTIEPTNCDCLETESSQPPQNEHLELF